MIPVVVGSMIMCVSGLISAFYIDYCCFHFPIDIKLIMRLAVRKSTVGELGSMESEASSGLQMGLLTAKRALNL